MMEESRFGTISNRPMIFSQIYFNVKKEPDEYQRREEKGRKVMSEQLTSMLVP